MLRGSSRLLRLGAASSPPHWSPPSASPPPASRPAALCAVPLPARGDAAAVDGDERQRWVHALRLLDATRRQTERGADARTAAGGNGPPPAAHLRDALEGALMEVVGARSPPDGHLAMADSLLKDLLELDEAIADQPPEGGGAGVEQQQYHSPCSPHQAARSIHVLGDAIHPHGDPRYRGGDAVLEQALANAPNLSQALRALRRHQGALGLSPMGMRRRSGDDHRMSNDDASQLVVVSAESVLSLAKKLTRRRGEDAVDLTAEGVDAAAAASSSSHSAPSPPSVFPAQLTLLYALLSGLRVRDAHRGGGGGGGAGDGEANGAITAVQFLGIHELARLATSRMGMGEDEQEGTAGQGGGSGEGITINSAGRDATFRRLVKSLFSPETRGWFRQYDGVLALDGFEGSGVGRGAFTATPCTGGARGGPRSPQAVAARSASAVRLLEYLESSLGRHQRAAPRDGDDEDGGGVTQEPNRILQPDDGGAHQQQHVRCYVADRLSPNALLALVGAIADEDAYRRANLIRKEVDRALHIATRLAEAPMSAKEACGHLVAVLGKIERGHEKARSAHRPTKRSSGKATYAKFNTARGGSGSGAQNSDGRGRARGGGRMGAAQEDEATPLTPSHTGSAGVLTAGISLLDAAGIVSLAAGHHQQQQHRSGTHSVDRGGDGQPNLALAIAYYCSIGLWDLAAPLAAPYVSSRLHARQLDADVSFLLPDGLVAYLRERAAMASKGSDAAFVRACDVLARAFAAPAMASSMAERLQSPNAHHGDHHADAGDGDGDANGDAVEYGKELAAAETFIAALVGGGGAVLRAGAGDDSPSGRAYHHVMRLFSTDLFSTMLAFIVTADEDAVLPLVGQHQLAALANNAGGRPAAMHGAGGVRDAVARLPEEASYIRLVSDAGPMVRPYRGRVQSHKRAAVGAHMASYHRRRVVGLMAAHMCEFPWVFTPPSTHGGDGDGDVLLPLQLLRLLVTPSPFPSSDSTLLTLLHSQATHALGGRGMDQFVALLAASHYAPPQLLDGTPLSSWQRLAHALDGSRESGMDHADGDAAGSNMGLVSLLLTAPPGDAVSSPISSSFSSSAARGGAHRRGQQRAPDDVIPSNTSGHQQRPQQCVDSLAGLLSLRCSFMSAAARRWLNDGVLALGGGRDRGRGRGHSNAPPMIPPYAHAVLMDGRCLPVIIQSMALEAELRVAEDGPSAGALLAPSSAVEGGVEGARFHAIFVDRLVALSKALSPMGASGPHDGCIRCLSCAQGRPIPPNMKALSRGDEARLRPLLRDLEAAGGGGEVCPHAKEVLAAILRERGYAHPR